MLIPTLLILFSQATQVGSGIVVVHTYDEYGQEVSAGLCNTSVTSWGDRSKDDLQIRLELPVGRHSLCIWTAGFQPAALNADVRPGERHYKVALRIAPIGDPVPTLTTNLRGLVQNAPGGLTWVRLAGIHLDIQSTVLVSREGRFVIPDVAPGAYLLYAVNGKNISPPTKITVGARSPEVRLDGSSLR